MGVMVNITILDIILILGTLKPYKTKQPGIKQSKFILNKKERFFKACTSFQKCGVKLKESLFEKLETTK